MKRYARAIALTVLVACASPFIFGCHGQNILFNKVHKWNGTIGNKWLRSIVHIALWIIPVYGICLFVDIVILNVVQFWTGSNPLAMAPGESETEIIAYENNLYEVTATRNRFDIVQLDGNKAGTKSALIYDESAKTWSYENDAKRVEFLEFDPENPETSRVIYPDGTKKDCRLEL